MKLNQAVRMLGSAVALSGMALLAGCSDREDPRITLCKNLTTALHPEAQSIEWTGGENSFYRPRYAVTGLTFDVVDSDGNAASKTAACHYAYEALDDTAVTLADPLSAYANLPFKMTLNGKAFSDRELLNMVNTEQKRLGRKAVDTLQKGAKDAMDKVRGSGG